MDAWPDRDEMLGQGTVAFTDPVTNPRVGSKPKRTSRVIGQATKRSRTSTRERPAGLASAASSRRAGGNGPGRADDAPGVCSTGCPVAERR